MHGLGDHLESVNSILMLFVVESWKIISDTGVKTEFGVPARVIENVCISDDERCQGRWF